MPRIIKFLVFLFGIPLCGLAQTHDWAFDLNVISGRSQIRSQVVDDSSNVYIAGVFRGSLVIGTDTFSFSGTSPTDQTIFLAKYDKDGDYIWGKSFTSASSANIIDMVINSQKEIILFGDGRGALTFGSTSFTRNNYVFAAFMTTSGSFTSAKELGYGFYSGARHIALGENDEIYVSMYLNGFGSGWRIVDGSGTKNGTGYVNTISKFNKTATSLVWSVECNIADIGLIYDLAVDKDNQVYFLGNITANKTVLGSTTPASSRTNYLVWLGSNGTYKDKVITTSVNGKQSNLSQIEVIDSTLMYIAGNSFNDSLGIGSSKVYSLTVNPNRSFFFVAELVDFDSISWYRSTSHRLASFNLNGKLKISGDFLFLSILQNSSGFSFGGLSTSAAAPAVVSKLDRLGNVLWFLPISSSSPPLLSAIGKQDLLYSGAFSGTISLSPFSFRNTASIPKPFIARTADYSITRGEVLEGPYCAGDSILIPYERAGEFDTANTFIAELSDEAGDFFGRQRELGRLKYDKDSTIVGTLPLFQVASSDKYRIRITSTNPVVQSYYRLDTLSLLIYSTDDADPGPDTSVCYGDTIQLSTFGGTIWSWSPAYNMLDSTVRAPLIFPRVDTVYQIIIGDSSGCGAPDTADIRVSIKASPEFIFQSQSDTIGCRDNLVKLIAGFVGGSETHYLRWFNNGGLIRTKATTDFSDSIEFRLSVNSNIMVVLTDSCSSIQDTAYFLIRVPENVVIDSFPPDTLVCKGESVDFFTSASHFYQDSISYLWRIGNTTLGTDSLLNFQANETSQIRLAIINSCNAQTVNYSFRVTTRPELATSISNMSSLDTFCATDNIVYAAEVSGGQNPSSVTPRWIINTDTVISDTLRLEASTLLDSFPTTYDYEVLAIADDGCTSPSDTTTFRFYIREPLQLDSLSSIDTLLCDGDEIEVRAFASAGYGVYGYQWTSGSQSFGTSSLAILNVDSLAKGWNMIQARVEDGCGSADSLTLDVFVPNDLNTNLGDDIQLCNGQENVFTSSYNGGLSEGYTFQWTVGSEVVSTTDSLLFSGINHSLFTDSSIQVLFNFEDGCMNEVSDSFTISVTPRVVISFDADSTHRLQNQDTTICRGEEILLSYTTFYNENERVNWLLDGVEVGLGENFTFDAIYQQAKSDYLLQVAVYDSCSQSSDTASIQIRLRDPLSLAALADTVLCIGTNVMYTAVASGGVSANYVFEWTDMLTGTTLSTTEVLLLSDVSTSRNIRLTLSDGCTVEDDAVDFETVVLGALDVQISTSDSCTDVPITLSAVGTGGRVATYDYMWYADNEVLASGSSVTVTPSSITEYKVVFKDGCTLQPDSATKRIGPKPSFEIDEIEDGCEPLEITWNATALTPDTYTFTLLDNSARTEENLQSTYEYMAEDYDFWIKGEDELGCIDSVRSTFTVKSLPNPAFSWSPDYPSYEQPEVTFLAQADNVEYSWFRDGVVVGSSKSYSTTFDHIGFYNVKLAVELEGCQDSLTNTVEFIDTYKWLDVNSFTPNNDGLNDVYTPYLTGVSIVRYEIYNRWGQLVFQGDKANPAWDGTFLGSPAQDGVYTVLLSVQDTKNRNYYYRSSLHLLR